MKFSRYPFRKRGKLTPIKKMHKKGGEESRQRGRKLKDATRRQKFQRLQGAGEFMF